MSLTSNTEALSSEESIRLIAQLVTDGQALVSLNLVYAVARWVRPGKLCLFVERKVRFQVRPQVTQIPLKKFPSAVWNGTGWRGGHPDSKFQLNATSHIIHLILARVCSQRTKQPRTPRTPTALAASIDHVCNQIQTFQTT